MDARQGCWSLEPGPAFLLCVCLWSCFQFAPPHGHGPTHTGELKVLSPVPATLGQEGAREVAQNVVQGGQTQQEVEGCGTTMRPLMLVAH